MKTITTGLVVPKSSLSILKTIALSISVSKRFMQGASDLWISAMTPSEHLPWCESFFVGEVNMQNSVNKSERNSLLTYVSVRHTR